MGEVAKVVHFMLFILPQVVKKKFRNVLKGLPRGCIFLQRLLAMPQTLLKPQLILTQPRICICSHSVEKKSQQELNLTWAVPIPNPKGSGVLSKAKDF